ncbi:hypothetical protein FOCC_FOCC012817 [Frankliniella occidentalis]|nr:hypothetical protein FOCC_FOCC012817 [Frankliniella occidentalis]
MLRLLKPHHPFLPLDSRTLKQTPTRTETKQLVNGQYVDVPISKYVHVGLRQSLILKMSQGLVAGCHHLALKVFIGGVKLYKSTKYECWPIVFSCRNFLEASPGVIGLFYGKGKPNRLEDFLEDYIEAIRTLIEDGIWFRGTRFTVDVEFYLEDALGRVYLKCVMGHGSAHGCERCDQEGDYLAFQTYQTAVGNLRTDQSFNDRRDPEHHHQQISPLTELQTGFISMFPLDPLHLLDLGIFKRFLSFVLRRGPVNSRMRGEDIQRFDDLLTLLANYIPYAKEFASQFVQYSAQVFGPLFVLYNEHSFLHLGDDAERFGRLSKFSAYPFESMLGDMKRLILSTARPLQQLHRRLQEKANAQARAKRGRENNRLSLVHTIPFMVESSTALLMRRKKLIPLMRLEPKSNKPVTKQKSSQGSRQNEQHPLPPPPPISKYPKAGCNSGCSSDGLPLLSTKIAAFTEFNGEPSSASVKIRESVEPHSSKVSGPRPSHFDRRSSSEGSNDGGSSTFKISGENSVIPDTLSPTPRTNSIGNFDFLKSL